MAKIVLLIEDSPVEVVSRQAILRKAGFDVHVARSVEMAMPMLKAESEKRRLGVVITDHLMPGASGSEFVRELRMLDQEIPVIVITGAAEAKEEYDDLNVIFRMKPLLPEEMVALVTEAMKR